jgi:hypothetical protein
MVLYPDKKWCGTRCGNSKTEKSTYPTIYKKDVINCPSGYSNHSVGSIPGAFGVLQWVRQCNRQITGSKLECALGKFEDKNCPNDYGKGSRASNAYMNTYCSGDGIVNRPECKQWKNANPIEYTKTLGTFCGNSVNNIYKYPECRSYCELNPGKCPVIHNRPGGYCSLYKDDPLCGCVNSPLNDFDGGSKAQPPATCFDNICMDSGYKPNPNYITGAACPDFMDCSQNINISDKAFLDRVNISQTCKIEKTLAASAEADAAAEAAASVAENNRESRLAATLAEETAFNAEKARRQLEYEKKNYAANTPAWKQSYDSMVTSPPLKQVTDMVNNIIPNTGIIIGEVEIDDIKPLALLFILMIMLIILSRRASSVNYNNTPVNNVYY